MTQPAEDETAAGREFLGAGLAFPLTVDSTGSLRMNSLDEHVRQSILLVLATASGERVMRPAFGAGTSSLLFDPVTAATVSLLVHEVRDALLMWEPRIDILDVTASLDQAAATILVELSYRVRRTDTMTNLVYPFYLERGADAPA